MTEEYDSIKSILEKVAYFKHQWEMYVDLNTEQGKSSL